MFFSSMRRGRDFADGHARHNACDELRQHGEYRGAGNVYDHCPGRGPY